MWAQYCTAANSSYTAVSLSAQKQNLEPVADAAAQTQAMAATAVALQVDVVCPEISLLVSSLRVSSVPPGVECAGAQPEMELLRLRAIGTTVGYRTRTFDNKLSLSLEVRASPCPKRAFRCGGESDESQGLGCSLNEGQRPTVCSVRATVA
jgi:hypothetical protein